MTKPANASDHPGGPVQGSFFGDGENKLQPPVQNFRPDPADIRRRLNAVLAAARAAPATPWPQREARMWQTVFPQMVNWLPEEEANVLLLAFAREIERLSAEPPSHKTNAVYGESTSYVHRQDV